MHAPRGPRHSEREQIDNLVVAHHQLLDALRCLDHKLDAIGEAVGVVSMPCGHALRSESLQSKVVATDSKLSPPSEEGDVSPAASTCGFTVRMRPGINSITASTTLHGMRAISSSRSPSKVVRPSHTLNLSNSLENELDEKRQRRWQAWNPDSRSRTIFDVTSMLVLLYDAFMVPYLLAWKVQVEGTVAMLTRIFWTLDMLLNLGTGYRGKESKLVLEPWKAVRHYVARWFLLDLLLVTFDWMSLSPERGQAWMGWLRVMRLVRSGRQVVRGWTLVLKAKLMIHSKAFHLVLELSLFVMIILWVNHCVCCGWYSIGMLETDTGRTWLTELEFRGDQFDYWTALHWAMTQMTPGSMEVVPRSTKERIYNVSILLLGMLMGSSLVATLTSMLTQYKLRVEGSSQKLMILHQFLVQQAVDPNLALAIKLQVKARSSQNQRLRAQDVDYLSLLSDSMQSRLFHSLCIKHLCRHQFLNVLELINPLAMKTVCKSAVQAWEYAEGDTVFEEGTIGDHMLFLRYGSLRYSSVDVAHCAVLQEDVGASLLLGTGSWCCEAALWTIWTHLGTLEAASNAEVLAVSGPRFLAALANYPAANEVVSDYCLAFHRHINEPGVVKTDLSCVVDNCELISNLSSETRLQLAAPVLERLENRLFFLDGLNRTKLENLKTEVTNGKCDVSLVDGEVVRNTSVVTIRLYKSPLMDHFLVRVGKVKLGTLKVSASCLLPGTKRQWRESHMSTFGRILHDELHELAPFVDLVETGGKRAVQLSDSPTFGIRTRYLLTTFTAVLSHGATLRHISAPSQALPEPHCSRFTAFLRPEAQRLADDQKVVVDILSAQKSLVAIHWGSEDSRSLYLWLTEREFDVLHQDSAKPILEKWLSSVDLLEEEVEEEGSSNGLQLRTCSEGTEATDSQGSYDI